MKGAAVGMFIYMVGQDYHNRTRSKIYSGELREKNIGTTQLSNVYLPATAQNLKIKKIKHIKMATHHSLI